MEALKQAAEAHDREAVIALFASDITVYSPITRRIRFEGIDEVRHLFECVFDVIEDIQFYETIGAGEPNQVIFWQGRVGRQYLEEANLLRLNEEGKIREMTVFMRPVPGLLELASRLASALARRRGRCRSSSVRWLVAVIAVVYRCFEPVIIWLVASGVKHEIRHLYGQRKR